MGKPIHRFRGQALGIIGLGKIGAALAGKARAFGLRILAYDPYLPADKARERGAEPVDFAALLRGERLHQHPRPAERAGRHGRDVRRRGVAGDEAHRFPGQHGARWHRRRQGAVRARCARASSPGPASTCLPSGAPAADSPLFELDNLILTPHAAFYAEESLIDLQMLAAQEVARVLTGQRPVS